MRTALNILVFAAAVALVASGIGMIVPPPVVAIVTPKVTYLQKHGDDYDVLFLGTSRTFRQVIPEQFDALLGAAGHKVKSFNLGVDGMRPPEDTYVLEQALQKRKSPLKWVFVEANPMRLIIRPEDRDTLRAIYWHDAKRITSLFQRSFLADTKKRGFRDRVKQFAKAWPDFEIHAWYFLQNSLQVGRGYTLLESLLTKGRFPEVMDWDLGKRRDGYRPSDFPPLMPPAELAIYEQQITRLRAVPPRIDYADWPSQEELRKKQRIIERAGGKMILLMAPFPAKRLFQPKLEADNPPLLLNFSSLERYPALFAPENHSDSGHLNAAGAEIYTREIVRSLLEHLN